MKRLAVFRADASLEIGSGHIMRCLVLAEALAESGWTSRFVCRNLQGNLSDRIAERGFAVDVLPQGLDFRYAAHPPHAKWLTVSQDTDAQQTLDVIGGDICNCVIVDHYALDVVWETAMRPQCEHIMAIDDLADRLHEVDVLLDQNLGRSLQDYHDLLTPKTRPLIGPDFALLGPRFAKLRAASLARRETGQMKRILITMGGVDKDNVTGRILSFLSANPPSGIEHVDVVLGANAPHTDVVGAQINQLPFKGQLHINTDKMADLMSVADVAVGAGGSTSWERCCLGVPTVMVVLADNQRDVARALHEAGAALSLGAVNETGFDDRLRAAFATLEAPKRVNALSNAARDICDGRGSARVVEQISSLCD